MLSELTALPWKGIISMAGWRGEVILACFVQLVMVQSCHVFHEWRAAWLSPVEPYHQATRFRSCCVCFLSTDACCDHPGANVFKASTCVDLPLNASETLRSVHL